MTLGELGIQKYDVAFIINKCCGCDLKQYKDANRQSWITIKNQKSIDYMNSVKDFIEHASNFVDNNGKVRSPCNKSIQNRFSMVR